MASVKNAPSHKRADTSGLPSVHGQRHESTKKSRNELRAIRAMGITAISLGLIALVLLGVKLLEGEQAGQNANALLAAYKAQASVSPSASAETATASPASSETPMDTPEPTDENFEQTNISADENASENANEHRVDDGSNTGVDESGEYVQPDAPEISELDKTIQKIIDATGKEGVIGLIEIPKYEVELPIIGKWSYKLLKISICRYKGPDPNEEGNLVLIGHNYKSGAHFGDLSELTVGSELFLTNTKTGERVRYEVYQIKHIAPDAFSALKSYHGTAGLTLMTCRNNGTNRLLIRCEQKEAVATPTPTLTPRITPFKTP